MNWINKNSAILTLLTLVLVAVMFYQAYKAKKAAAVVVTPAPVVA